ncbi:glycosyltransferase family 61 protein [Paracoccus sp. Z330]|uniref:Glycosyltransferase family 61 protein n=1 Tax=Paracoccus onchidii TaxID=3017813 RepID=A0ABT4ZIP2_9RHOB|nr:glycosyltransferase family 61 protein [Paracoccus onchidii]MDB6179234.1 glycosyltransferase family 61 protein [Paracoccus onchidii]
MLDLFRPFNARFRKIARLQHRDFFDGAVETWELAPAETLQYQSSFHLPGQVERIRASVFAPLPDTIEALTRAGLTHEGPTRAWRLENVDLIDGVLYHNGGEYHLHKRKHPLSLGRRPQSRASGVLYETWATNRWFGSWLMDACVAYDLAAGIGQPVTTMPRSMPGAHQAEYETLIGMAPIHLDGDIHFDELVMLDDLANNSHKGGRARALRNTLVRGREPEPVPGVFLLRGQAGDQRLLTNEQELAALLERERGFKVIDPLSVSVDELIDACAAAKAIVGVEGSHLVHGLTVAPEGAAIVPIQPPERVAATLKQQSDRLGQRFGLLVAEGSHDIFHLRSDELLATLDLFD